MYYRHDLPYVYPDRSDEHMITVPKQKETNFDENFPYLPRGAKKVFLRSSFFLAFNLLAFPVCYLRYGLRYFGKENIKKHKKELQNGAITVCNHVFMWDYLCVLGGIRPHLPYFPAWKTNFEGPNRGLIRWSGGVPVPTHSHRAMRKFHHSMEELFEEGKWVHFFPEGSMWFFYPNLRPLKIQVFRYAAKYQKPIIPFALSFRPRRGIFRLFGKSPAVDVHIGAPQYADPNLSVWDAAEELRCRTAAIMQEMLGVKPEDEGYLVSHEIEEYQKTM